MSLHLTPRALFVLCPDPIDYRAALNNLLVQLAVLALNEGREGRRYR